MDLIQHMIVRALRRSESFFKTDMVYVTKNSFWIGAGQFASAVLALGLSLFFANYISKDVYGNYKFVLSVTSVLGALSLSGMGVAVAQGVAAGKEGIFDDAIKTSLRWGLIVSVVAAISALYYFINGNAVLGLSLLIAGVVLPLLNAYGLYGSFLAGKKDFRASTAYSIYIQSFSTLVVISTAIFTANVFALILAYFLSNLIGTIIAYRRTLSVHAPEGSTDRSLIAYSKHLSINNLLGTAASQLDKILIFHYLGALELAVYTFAQAIPEQIKGVFKNVFGIAVPKYTVLSKEQVRKSILGKILILTTIAVVAAGLYITAAPVLFSALFPKYLEAIPYSQIYALGLAVIPGNYLFGIYFQVSKATRAQYKLNIVGNAITILLTFILVHRFGLLGAVIENGLSWLTIFCYSLYLFIQDGRTTEKLAA